MKLNNLAPFYVQEYQRERTKSEERLIFCWIQLLEKKYQIYNVANRHDCHRVHETLLANRQCEDDIGCIIQPFPSFSHFYGCMICGKYHLCQQRRESCHIASDKHDKQKVCRYSGKVLLVQDNLEVPNFLEERRTEREATYANTSERRNGSGVASKKKHSRESIIALHKEQQVQKQQQRVMSRKRIHHHRETFSEPLHDIYDMSLDSITEEESQVVLEDVEENDEQEEHPHTFEEEHDDENEEHTSEQEEEELLATRPKKRFKINEEEEEKNPEDDPHSESSFENQEEEEEFIYESGNEEAEEGELFVYENENDAVGGGGYSKNYHNNIRYKNDYYAFLWPVISHEQHQIKKGSSLDHFVDLYHRDIQEEAKECLSTLKLDSEEKSINNNNNAYDDSSALGENVKNKISDETRYIIDILLKLDEPYHYQKFKHHTILERLVSYFVPLIENITALIYQSPVLNKLAAIRSTKNQNQVSKFAVAEIDLKSAEQIQRNIDYHEYTLCPTKITRALLLHLFVEPFAATDLQGYRIEIWHSDAWLTTFNNESLARNLIHDFYIKMGPRSPPSRRQLASLGSSSEKHLVSAHFKKDLLEVASLVLDSLVYYNFGPLWLRHMVFK
jgi:hypothetical protein